MAVTINKGRALSSLSLTPLIDVVFLLLIFFLVATKFAEEDHEMDVQLPSASEARPLTSQPLELFVGISDSGTFFVGGREVTHEELDDTMGRAVENNPINQSVVIRADKRVPFDYVVQVMDLCNRHAITDYKVTTEK
ncbi:MAG: biopolymer transporter ExbD [Planctomycetales bacterium]|nr:biopolymer transporter ExbD [Planctomycetales bacterium]